MSLHLLWVISNTTKRPTTSKFLQLFRTSAKFFQSAFFAILYQPFRDAPHSLCLAVASLIAFRLTIRMTNLRILRRLSQAENDVPFGELRSIMRSSAFSKTSTTSECAVGDVLVRIGSCGDPVNPYLTRGLKVCCVPYVLPR